MREAPKRARSWILIAAVALQPGAALSQSQALEEEERVIAVDVFIELEADVPGGAGKVRSLPKGLHLDDFEVRIGGELRPVVSFLDPRSAIGRLIDAAGEPLPGELLEPWTIVLYFDLELAERDTLRWAAAELAERVADLVELGEVELVVAQKGRNRGLAPTRDAELLEAELAGMMIDPGGVHEVIEFRGEVLDAIRAGTGAGMGEVRAAELGRAFVAQEVAAVESRLDELLIHLSERDVQGSKRALFWVSDGFDLEPAKFYRSQGLEVAPGAPSLADRAAEIAATLASYGWVTFGLSPPAAGPGLVPGFRIGKWLYRARMPPMKGIGGTLIREERRDPGEARAYTELGDVYLEGDDPKSAQKAFERALYHFAGDPRTMKDQAAAKAGLGRALEAQGDFAGARQAFRHAVELDPDLASQYPQARPRLLEPLAFLEVLAQATAGRTVLDSDDLAEAVLSLSRRARLTYQISGWPQGSIQDLEVALLGSALELRHPRRARSGTPETVAAARARRLAGGDLVAGDLKVRAALDSKSEEVETLLVEVDRESLAGEDTGDRPIRVRVTLATGRPDGVPTVNHERIEIASSQDDNPWRYRAPIAKLGAEEWIVVVVENVETGRWGAALID